MKKYLLILIAAFLFLSSTAIVFAATGTIDATNHYAWNDNGGWVNWDANGGNVSVTDTALTGYIWSANFGWINLAPDNGGVTNSNGTLGGYAWGASTGWISFSGVTIDNNGVFHGHTVAQNVFGTMTFDCDNCEVVTTWRAGGSSSYSSSSSGGGGGGVISGPSAVGYQNSTTTATSTTTVSTVAVPPTLIPTSKPAKSQQPTSKPPSSSKSSAYTSQQPPTSQTFPTSTIQTDSRGGTVATPPIAPVVAPKACTWFGACWWQAAMSFFARLFRGL